MVPGVKIVLASGNGPAQTLYYFRTDVSNCGVAGQRLPEIRRDARQRQRPAQERVLPDAQRQLHPGPRLRAGALAIRSCRTTPAFRWRRSGRTSWNFQPFGAYLGPIAIFPGRSQPRLGELFKKAKAPPLDFGIGYRHRVHDFEPAARGAQGTAEARLAAGQPVRAARGHVFDCARRYRRRTHANGLLAAAWRMAADDRAPAPAEKQE